MADWGSFKYTKAGFDLIAAAHSGSQLALTSIVLGSGTIPEGQDARELTELISRKQEFPIREIIPNNDGTVTIKTRINNENLTAGYSIKECGIMAKSAEGTEVLFGISMAEEPDFMPAIGKATVVDSEMSITIVISNDVKIIARIDMDAYATIKYSDEKDDEVYEKAKALLKGIVNSIDILPVGTILAFNGDVSKIPNGWAICDGTNGTPNLTGRFLEGVAATRDKGKWKDAGLPNIRGEFDANVNDGNSGKRGAFYNTGRYFNGADGQSGGGIVGFDASRSNGIYGKSSTVQPNSYTVLYIMKVKSAAFSI